MNTATISAPAASLARRNDRALRSLMTLWAREPLAETEAEAEESEVSLMIMLSGMVGPHATAFDPD